MRRKKNRKNPCTNSSRNWVTNERDNKNYRAGDKTICTATVPVKTGQTIYLDGVISAPKVDPEEHGVNTWVDT